MVVTRNHSWCRDVLWQSKHRWVVIKPACSRETFRNISSSARYFGECGSRERSIYCRGAVRNHSRILHTKKSLSATVADGNEQGGIRSNITSFMYVCGSGREGNRVSHVNNSHQVMKDPHNKTVQRNILSWTLIFKDKRTNHQRKYVNKCQNVENALLSKCGKHCREWRRPVYTRETFRDVSVEISVITMDANQRMKHRLPPHFLESLAHGQMKRSKVTSAGTSPCPCTSVCDSGREAYSASHPQMAEGGGIPLSVLVRRTHTKESRKVWRIVGIGELCGHN